MKRARFLIVICLLSCSQFGHSSGIINGSFEQAGTGNEDFTPPAGWAHENYAGLHNSFAPTGSASWSISAPFEGNQFVVLSTCGFNNNPNTAIQFSQLSQQTTFNAGDILSFAWFFGTIDYMPYDDFATANLVLVDAALNEITLVDISVEDVGNYHATDGWQTTTYTFDNTTAGQYDLIFEVRDAVDAQCASYFAIDAITVVPEPATLILLTLGGLILRKKRK